MKTRTTCHCLRRTVVESINRKGEAISRIETSPGGKPLTVATFRHGDLVMVERRHWVSDGCHEPAVYLDPDAYLLGVDQAAPADTIDAFLDETARIAAMYPPIIVPADQRERRR